MKKQKLQIKMIVLSIVFGLVFMSGQVFAQTNDPPGENEYISGLYQNRINQLMGKKAVDQQGKELGEIKDLVIDENGLISYIVLSKSEASASGGELVPIPFKPTSISMQQDRVTLENVDQAKLESAPSYTTDEWETLRRLDLDKEVRGYFGEEGTPTRMGVPDPSKVMGPEGVGGDL